MKLLNQAGLSLIEISIAGAVAIGLALGGAQLFKNQTTAQKTVEANYEVAGTLQQMRGILNDPSNCLLSLQGNRPDMDPATEGATIDRLKKRVPVTAANPTGEADVFIVNQKQPGNITVLSYIVRKNDTTLAADEALLHIVFSRGKAALREQVDKKLKITYTLNATGQILGCSAVISGDSEIWQRSTVDPNDIYYNDGKVGLGPGMADPQHALDIAGSLRATNGADSILLTGLSITGSGAVNLSPGVTITGDLATSGNVSSTASFFGQNATLSGIVTGATGNFSASVTAQSLVATTAVQSPSFQYTSDRSLKKDIRPLEGALERISRRNGVEFSWKDDSRKDHGFIAQDVQRQEPILVGSTKDGLKTVKYGNVTALLVEAVKELRLEVNRLKKRNDILEKKLRENNQ